jgi:YidC/Oxa1 family membrane protein insertase
VRKAARLGERLPLAAWDVFKPLHSAWWALFGVPLLGFLHGLVQLLAAWPVTLALGPFGLAVIVMTVLVRVVMLPLAAWQVRSSLAARRRAADIQARLGPEIARLRRRHRRDPRALQDALNELLRKHGVNPLATLAPGVGSSLVTGLVQMPVLIAFYQVILTLAHGGGLDLQFLWIGSLAVPDPLLLPLLAGAPRSRSAAWPRRRRRRRPCGTRGRRSRPAPLSGRPCWSIRWSSRSPATSHRPPWCCTGSAATRSQPVSSWS